MSNARNLSDLLGTGTTIATASIADDAITSAKIADDAVVAAAIADGAVATAALADDAVTFAKTDNILGSALITHDNSVASATNNNWRNMSSVTLPADSVLADFGNMMSVGFMGYISSGSYYWTWRLYDSTDSEVLTPIGVSNYNWYGNTDGTGGGFRFVGTVHSNSNQPCRTVDVTGRGGNTVQLQMHGSDGGGSTVSTSSQTLYCDQTFYFGGFVSGLSNENGY